MSCIIPTRNRAGLVGDAIASALGQSYKSLEVIVVDDGSTDGTSSVLARFGHHIRVLRTAGIGVAAARNLGLAAARGRYVAFLDSDDLWHTDKLALQLDFMRRRPDLGLSFTDYMVSERAGDGSWRIVSTRRYHGESSLRRLVARNFIGALTVMARRDVITSTGAFDVSLERGSDYHLWLRIARRHPFARLPFVLADYRWHNDSLTGGSRKRGLESYADVISRLAASDPGLFALIEIDPNALLANAEQRFAEPWALEEEPCIPMHESR